MLAVAGIVSGVCAPSALGNPGRRQRNNLLQPPGDKCGDRHMWRPMPGLE